MPEQKLHSGTDRRYRLIISNSAAAPITSRKRNRAFNVDSNVNIDG
ncbi:hypothetical protein [uncultured Parasutterella sp.]|nr:hypothetical protein [uncultured Parasutterella sp.]